MGVLAYVQGVITSFGNGATMVTSDSETQDLLRQILVELRVQTAIWADELQLDNSIDQLRSDVTEEME